MLAGLTAATLFTTFVLWAALHDICQANQSNYLPEYAFVGLAAIAYVAIYRAAFKLFHGKQLTMWLAGTLLLHGLLIASALSALFNPKYPNDVVVGTAFLLLTSPFLAYCVSRLVRLARSP